MIAAAISGFGKDALTGALMIEFVLSLVRNSRFLNSVGLLEEAVHAITPNVLRDHS
jgi:hypothetical protein